MLDSIAPEILRSREGYELEYLGRRGIIKLRFEDTESSYKESRLPVEAILTWQMELPVSGRMNGGNRS